MLGVQDDTPSIAFRHLQDVVVKAVLGVSDMTAPAAAVGEAGRQASTYTSTEPQ